MSGFISAEQSDISDIPVWKSNRGPLQNQAGMVSFFGSNVKCNQCNMWDVQWVVFMRGTLVDLELQYTTDLHAHMAEQCEYPDAFSSKVDLDSRHMGWVTSELPGGDHHVIKVELKGPENTLRVRQVKVLGWKEGESIKILGQISASMAQQKNCEAETLRVFRLITSQVCLTASKVLFLLLYCTVCLKP